MTSSPPTFDLQSHSVFSDGALEPVDVVARAAHAGVELLALTDHDCVDGVAMAVQAGAAHAITVVPGAELSALDGEHEDLHICGYGLDVTSPVLLEALADFREDRNARGARMADALAECGLALDRAPLAARAAGGMPVGRPHLAAAVLAEPVNAARLAAENIDSVGAFIAAYLVPGRPGYRRRTRPTVAEVITLIHAAEGVAVWAHPFWDVADDAEVLSTIDRFVADGLDGVEVFYTTHDERQTRLLYAEVTARGLLTTGSADFHGPDHAHFNRFRAFSTYGLEPVLGPLAPA